jgi:hypothetical protein
MQIKGPTPPLDNLEVRDQPDMVCRDPFNPNHDWKVAVPLEWEKTFGRCP